MSRGPVIDPGQQPVAAGRTLESVNSSTTTTAVAHEPGRTRTRLPRWMRFGWVFVAVVVIGLWSLLTGTKIVDTTLFPSPTRLSTAYSEVTSNGQLWNDISTTLHELGLAVLLFVVVGTTLGVLLGASARRFDIAYGPISTLFAMPKITVLPVFVLAFGLGLRQKVLFGALYGLFPLVMNTMVGARAVPVLYTQLFDSIGARLLFRTLRLTLPSMLPFFLTGLRIGYVYAGIGVLLAEMYVSTQGLGQDIVSAADRSTLDHFWVFVLAATIILVIGAGIIKLIENRLASWRG